MQNTSSQVRQELEVAEAREIAAHDHQSGKVHATTVLRRPQPSFKSQEPRLDENLRHKLPRGSHEFVLNSKEAPNGEIGSHNEGVWASQGKAVTPVSDPVV